MKNMGPWVAEYATATYAFPPRLALPLLPLLNDVALVKANCNASLRNIKKMRLLMNFTS